MMIMINDNDEWSEFIEKTNTQQLDDMPESAQKQSKTDDSIDSDTDDEWCEETKRSSCVMDTLLQEPDMI